MHGLYSKGILLIKSNCNDPAREQSLNKWLDDVHLPQITKTGPFNNPTRYVARQVAAHPEPEQTKYVTIAETDAGDLEGVLRAFLENAAAWERSGAIHNAHDVASFTLYERTGREWVGAANKPVKGILLVFSNCRDLSREADFNKWYDDIHMPDMVESGFYHTGYRFKAVAPGGKLSRYFVRHQYLAIYETDQDPAAAWQGIIGIGPRWRTEGRSTDLLAGSSRPHWAYSRIVRDA